MIERRSRRMPARKNARSCRVRRQHRRGSSQMNSVEEMIDLAKAARHFAHAPYSNFNVGAALLTSDDRVFTGCNVENSTYGLSMCAERVAIFKAISEGVTGIAKVVVVTDHENIAP